MSTRYGPGLRKTRGLRALLFLSCLDLIFSPPPTPPPPPPHPTHPPVSVPTPSSPPKKGTFGFVDLALDATSGGYVAVKFLERGPGVNKAVLREILNHRLCAAHPHIVRFIEVFLTASHLAIVMEYAPGGDMFEWVLTHRVPGPVPAGLPEADARHFFQQLVCAVEFAHELGVANRDIKLENTLLDDAAVSAGSSRLPDVKICDFGYSKNEFVDSRPKSVSGTPDYIAPEVKKEKKREERRERERRRERRERERRGRGESERDGGQEREGRRGERAKLMRERGGGCAGVCGSSASLSLTHTLLSLSLPPFRSCSTTSTMARRRTSGRAG